MELVNPKYKKYPLAINLFGLTNDDDDKKVKGLKLKEFENIGKNPGYTTRIRHINVQYIRNLIRYLKMRISKEGV